MIKSAIKSLKEIKPCAILYMVTELDKEFINELIKPTIDGYIEKPISRDQLLFAANKLIGLNERYRKSIH